MTTGTKEVTSNSRKALAMGERQSATASLLNKHLGPFMKTHPRLWAHRTFLTIVGKVYEHLVMQKAISPKEFFELTRALVESCKIKNTGCRGEPAQPSNLGDVVDGLEKVVRQIYGTNMRDSDVPKPASTSGSPSAACSQSTASSGGMPAES